MLDENTQELVTSLNLVDNYLKDIATKRKAGIFLESAFLLLLQNATVELIQYPVQAGKKYKSLFSINESEHTCEQTSIWHDVVSLKVNPMKLVTLQRNGETVFDENGLPIRVPILSLLYKEKDALRKKEQEKNAELAQKTKAATALANAAHTEQLNSLV